VAISIVLSPFSNENAYITSAVWPKASGRLSEGQRRQN